MDGRVWPGRGRAVLSIQVPFAGSGWYIPPFEWQPFPQLALFSWFQLKETSDCGMRHDDSLFTCGEADEAALMESGYPWRRF